MQTRPPTALSPYVDSYLSAVSTSISKRIAAIAADDPSPRFQVLRDLMSQSVQGGKMLRAQCALTGWNIIQPDVSAAVVALGAALELFQASALVHDDLIDNSALRRGRPTIHIAAAESLRSGDFSVPAPKAPEAQASFGCDSAVIIGDILFSLAFEALDEACLELDSPAAQTLRHTFSRMTTRVGIGQFLDNLLDVEPLTDNLDQRRTREVITYKTAGYSVVDPICLGAALSGLSTEIITRLHRALLPWGEGFQLRDDLLGVTATEQTVGKPAYHDLREGKKTTLLVSLWQSLQRADPPAAQWLAKVFAQQQRSKSDCEKIFHYLQEYGVLEEQERNIAQLLHQGEMQLRQLELESGIPLAASGLQDLGGRLLQRTH